MLVSDSDVESYKQIKSDLDILRQSVEKSELWVYKAKATDELGASESAPGAENLEYDATLSPEQRSEYQKVKEILIRMNKFCVTAGEWKLRYIYSVSVGCNPVCHSFRCRSQATQT